MSKLAAMSSTSEADLIDLFTRPVQHCTIDDSTSHDSVKVGSIYKVCVLVTFFFKLPFFEKTIMFCLKIVYILFYSIQTGWREVYMDDGDKWLRGQPIKFSTNHKRMNYLIKQSSFPIHFEASGCFFY